LFNPTNEIEKCNIIYIGLNNFFIIIIVVFVTDGPHFDRMFKMVIIFAIRVLFSLFL